MIGLAVAVALLVSVIADWPTDTKVLAATVISGPGAGVILWLRMERLPESPPR